MRDDYSENVTVTMLDGEPTVVVWAVCPAPKRPSLTLRSPRGRSGIPGPVVAPRGRPLAGSGNPTVTRPALRSFPEYRPPGRTGGDIP